MSGRLDRLRAWWADPPGPHLADDFDATNRIGTAALMGGLDDAADARAPRDADPPPPVAPVAAPERTPNVAPERSGTRVTVTQVTADSRDGGHACGRNGPDCTGQHACLCGATTPRHDQRRTRMTALAASIEDSDLPDAPRVDPVSVDALRMLGDQYLSAAIEGRSTDGTGYRGSLVAADAAIATACYAAATERRSTADAAAVTNVITTGDANEAVRKAVRNAVAATRERELEADETAAAARRDIARAFDVPDYLLGNAHPETLPPAQPGDHITIWTFSGETFSGPVLTVSHRFGAWVVEFRDEAVPEGEPGWTRALHYERDGSPPGVRVKVTRHVPTPTDDDGREPHDPEVLDRQRQAHAAFLNDAAADARDDADRIWRATIGDPDRMPARLLGLIGQPGVSPCDAP